MTQLAEKPTAKELDDVRLIDLLRQMMLIRRFEEKAAEMYARSRIAGFLHLYIGQEAVAVGAIAALNDDDHILTHYRNHGHALARGLEPGGILALSTPNVGSIGWWLLREDWGAVEPQVHLHLFRPDGLSRLVNACGLETRSIQMLDIQPATVKRVLRKLKRGATPEARNSVAAMADSLSEAKVRFVFGARRWLNVPLNMWGLGEDIYGFFTKPDRI